MHRHLVQFVGLSDEIRMRCTFRALAAGSELRRQGCPSPPSMSSELLEWTGPSPIRDGWWREDRRIRLASRPQRDEEPTRIMTRRAVA